MEKVLLAIGNRQIEEYLEKKLEDSFRFVGTSTYRGGVIKNVEENEPDIIILREALKGRENLSQIIYDIRRKHPTTRIIFITGNREPGDEMLAMLVNMQIFDILASERITASEILGLVKKPNTYADVSHYQPKMIVDDQTKRLLFEAPDAPNVVKKVEKVVFVERPAEPAVTPTEAPVEPKSRLGRRLLHQPAVEEAQTKDVPVTDELSEKPGKKKLRFSRKAASVESPDALRDAEEKRQAAERERQLAEERERLRVLEKERQREKALEEKRQAEENRKHAEAMKLVEEEKLKREALHLKTLELQKQLQENDKNRDAEQFLSHVLPAHSKQKIITFIGGEHGVGNTQVALNTSIQLAQNGYKTIYIELKEKPSTVDYLYQLHRNVENGLEVALFNLETQDYRGVHKSITRMKDVIERTREGDLMLDYYKTFPQNLDFLFFSPTYTESGNELMAGNANGLKELCMHLLFESGYHFIILDADIESSNPYTEVALRFGTQVFYTLTQDVCHIGNSVRHVAELSKTINLKDKLHYIVNKYDDAELNRAAVSDWLKTDVQLFVPNANKEFINANYTGQPVLLGTKQKDVKRAFADVAQRIQNM